MRTQVDQTVSIKDEQPTEAERLCCWSGYRRILAVRTSIVSTQSCGVTGIKPLVASARPARKR